MKLQIGQIFSTCNCEILFFESKINWLVKAKLFMTLQTYFGGMKQCQRFSCAAEKYQYEKREWKIVFVWVSFVCSRPVWFINWGSFLQNAFFQNSFFTDSVCMACRKTCCRELTQFSAGADFTFICPKASPLMGTVPWEHRWGALPSKASLLVTQT